MSSCTLFRLMCNFSSFVSHLRWYQYSFAPCHVLYFQRFVKVITMKSHYLIKHDMLTIFFQFSIRTMKQNDFCLILIQNTLILNLLWKQRLTKLFPFWMSLLIILTIFWIQLLIINRLILVYYLILTVLLLVFTKSVL